VENPTKPSGSSLKNNEPSLHQNERGNFLKAHTLLQNKPDFGFLF
jgi:hypothetical protein